MSNLDNQSNPERLHVPEPVHEAARTRVLTIYEALTLFRFLGLNLPKQDIQADMAVPIATEQPEATITYMDEHLRQNPDGRAAEARRKVTESEPAEIININKYMDKKVGDA